MLHVLTVNGNVHRGDSVSLLPGSVMVRWTVKTHLMRKPVLAPAPNAMHHPFHVTITLDASHLKSFVMATSIVMMGLMKGVAVVSVMVMQHFSTLLRLNFIIESSTFYFMPQLFCIINIGPCLVM